MRHLISLISKNEKYFAVKVHWENIDSQSYLSSKYSSMIKNNNINQHTLHSKLIRTHVDNLALTNSNVKDKLTTPMKLVVSF